jgi:hypothetical protein
VSTGRVLDPKFYERESTKSSVDDLILGRGDVSFRLKSDYLELGFNGWKSTSLLEVSGAAPMTLENPRERLIFAPGGK